MTLLTPVPVPVCAALVAHTVRAVYGQVRARMYGPVSVRSAVVRCQAVAVLVRALYEPVRVRPVRVRPYVRKAGTGRSAYPGMARVPGLGPVPGLYLARTWAGQDRRARCASVAVPVPWPTLNPAAGYGRTRTGTGQVRGRRPVSPYRPKRLKGEQGRGLRRELAARDGARCLYCGRADDPAALTLDHYVPFAWARRHRWRQVHEPWNLVLACEACNSAKGDALPWPLVWLLLAHEGRPVRVELAAAA